MEMQITDSYAKAYVEILEIINHMGEEYKRKIPSKLLDFFEKNKDTNYIKQSAGKTDKEVFLAETVGILAMLESKYWATSEEKEILDKALKENEIAYQKELREKYNPDNIFKKLEQEKKIEEVKTNELFMIEYKESIFKRLINKIKNIFHI